MDILLLNLNQLTYEVVSKYKYDVWWLCGRDDSVTAGKHQQLQQEEGLQGEGHLVQDGVTRYCIDH